MDQFSEPPIFEGNYQFGDLLVSYPTRAQLLRHNVSELDIDMAILEKAKEAKILDIKAEYEKAISLPLVSNGFEWDQTPLSPTYLDGEIRYNESIGSVTVEFVDFNNVTHNLSLDIGKQILSDVTMSFRTNFFKRQSLIKLVEAIAYSETAMVEVEAVKW